MDTKLQGIILEVNKDIESKKMEVAQAVKTASENLARISHGIETGVYGIYEENLENEMAWVNMKMKEFQTLTIKKQSIMECQFALQLQELKK